MIEDEDLDFDEVEGRETVSEPRWIYEGSHAATHGRANQAGHGLVTLGHYQYIEEEKQRDLLHKHTPEGKLD